MTRRLARAVRFLEQPAAPKNDSHTIIDEPDPAGFGDDKNPERGDDEEAPPPSGVGDNPGSPIGVQPK